MIEEPIVKRDLDLARNILRTLEDYKGFKMSRQFHLVRRFHIEGHSDEEVSYHVALLHDAGLIEAFDRSTMGRSEWRPERLTWSGHEILEASRSDSLWSQAKDTVVKNTGGMTFDLLLGCLKQLGTKAIQGDIGG